MLFQRLSRTKHTRLLCACFAWVLLVVWGIPPSQAHALGAAHLRPTQEGSQRAGLEQALQETAVQVTPNVSNAVDAFFALREQPGSWLSKVGLEEDGQTNAHQRGVHRSTGLDEDDEEVSPKKITYEPQEATTEADGITIPLGRLKYEMSGRFGNAKIVLPAKYKLGKKRKVVIHVVENQNHVYPITVDRSTPAEPKAVQQESLIEEGRLLSGMVIRLDFEHEGDTVQEFLMFTGMGAGFKHFTPGMHPISLIALSPELWHEQITSSPIDPFQAVARRGYIIHIGHGEYHTTERGQVRIELPRHIFEQEEDLPVSIRMVWEEDAYPTPDGKGRRAGYVILITVERPGVAAPAEDGAAAQPATAAQTYEYKYRFTGRRPGFVSMDQEEFLKEVAPAVEATQGHPGDLLDILLTLYGDRYTPDEIRDFVRKFDELNLGEVVPNDPDANRTGRAEMLLAFFFKQADLVNAKDERDRETLISVFLKVAFRQLAKPETRDALMVEIEAMSTQGEFFAELFLRAKELVNEGLKFQPDHIRTTMIPYQRVGAHAFSTHTHFFNHDFTGLGKTLQVLAGLDITKKNVIAVPASLISNWEKEIEKHLTPEAYDALTVHVVRGNLTDEETKRLESQVGRELKTTLDKKRAQLEALPDDNCICLMSIEGARWIRDEKPADLESTYFSGVHALVVDESQWVANFKGFDAKRNSQQAQAIHMIPSERRYFLSATGYGSNPHDLFSTVAAMTRGTPDEAEFTDYGQFTKLYPTSEAAGLRYLRSELRTRGMGREPEEVIDRYEDPETAGIPLEQQGKRLPNLNTIPYREAGAYEMNDEQVLLLLMMISNFREFANWYNEHLPPGRERLTERHMNPWTKLRFIFDLLVDPQRVGGTTESPIWEALDGQIQPALERGERIVLFRNHHAVANKMEDRYMHNGTEHIGRNVHMPRIDQTTAGPASYPLPPDAPDGAKREPVMGRLVDGEWVIGAHPEAVRMESKAYQRAQFQDPGTDAPLINVGMKAGGVGLDLTAATRMIEVELPDVFTRLRQIRGRPIRVDEKRPRLKVDEVRMVAVFPEKLRDPETFNALIPPEHADLMQRLLDSGTPAELHVERLEVGESVFRYVMTDLATDADLEVLNPNSLAGNIPGFMADPTMDEYLASLASQPKLQQTLGLFLPLWTEADGEDARAEILRLADLYYRTGQIDQMDQLVGILPAQDPEGLQLLSSLMDIPNRYARGQWLERVIPLVTQDLAAAGMDLVQAAQMTDFLPADVTFLALPMMEVTRAYDNGGSFEVLRDLVTEVLDETENAHQRRLRTQQLALWMLSVGQRTHEGVDLGAADPREDLREVLQEHGTLLTDHSIPLERRLAATERLFRVISFPRSPSTIMSGTDAGDFDSFEQALMDATVVASQTAFDMGPADARQFAENFPAALTALQIQGPVAHKYPDYNPLFSEVYTHVARGNYNPWRNQQQGARAHGSTVEYMQDQDAFWAVVAREDTVALDTSLVVDFDRKRQQLNRDLETVASMLEADNGEYVHRMEGEWAQALFNSHVENPAGYGRAYGNRRKFLAQAKTRLDKAGDVSKMTGKQAEAVQAEGIQTTQEAGVVAAAVQTRLDEYDAVGQWLAFVKDARAMTAKSPKAAQVRDMRRNVIPRLIGRANQRGGANVADKLDRLAGSLETLKERTSFGRVTVQFTTDPAFMTERGMLHPQMVDCFNCFGDPDQTSTLADDLGSRNKVLALVWPEGVEPRWENRHQILARSVVKVKRTQDRKPVLYPERSLAIGSYDFIPEILTALSQAKMPDLSTWATELAWEGATRDKEDWVQVYETGGYAPHEYFEPLFGVWKREGRQTGIHHRALMVTSNGNGQPAETAAGQEESQSIRTTQPGLEDIELYLGETLSGPEFAPTGKASQTFRSRVSFRESVWEDVNSNDGAVFRHYPVINRHGKAAFRTSDASYYKTDRDFDAEQNLTLLVQVDADGKPVIAYAEDTLDVIYHKPKRETPPIEMYLGATISGMRLDSTGPKEIISGGVRSISSARWDSVGPAGGAVFRHYPTWNKDGKYGFRVAGQLYVTTARFSSDRPLTLLVQVDSENIPLLAVAEDIQEVVYRRPEQEKVPVQMYLGETLNGPEFESTAEPQVFVDPRTIYAEHWQQVRKASGAVYVDWPTRQQNSRYAFAMAKTTYVLEKKFDPEYILKLLVQVDEDGKPVIAYDRNSGEVVYRVDTEKVEINLYPGAALDGTAIVASQSPLVFSSTRSLKAGSWSSIRQSGGGVLEHYTPFNHNGKYAFRVKGEVYRTGVEIDESRLFRLLIQVDADGKPMIAYAEDTSEIVYEASTEETVPFELYLGEKASATGIAPEGKADVVLKSRLLPTHWARIKEAGGAVIRHYPAREDLERVVFQLRRKIYTTNLSLGSESQPKLLIEVDAEGIPVVAYAEDTREEVYRASSTGLSTLMDLAGSDGSWLNLPAETSVDVLQTAPSVTNLSRSRLSFWDRMSERERTRQIAEQTLLGDSPRLLKDIRTPLALPRSPGYSQSELVVGLEELFDGWTSSTQTTDAFVLSDTMLADANTVTVKATLALMPQNLARRTYLVGEGWGGLEEQNPFLNIVTDPGLESTAVVILQQTPEPNAVWMVGENLVGLGGMLRNFGITIKPLTAPSNIAEFLLQMGRALGVPEAILHSTLETFFSQQSLDLAA